MTTPDYTTLISTLTAEGWTEHNSTPLRRGALPARTITSPIRQLRLHLISTGPTTLAILECVRVPSPDAGEDRWQVRAEDPDPAAYIAAARAAYHVIATGVDQPDPHAALRSHGWLDLSPDGLNPVAYSSITPDHTRRLVRHPSGQSTEITLPRASAYSSSITATTGTPNRILVALALAPDTPHPAVGVYDGEEIDNQTRADWAREILQRYADRHYGLDGDRDFDLDHGFAAEQALRDVITNALHLLDTLGFTEHDRETTLRLAYDNYVEERAEEDDEHDAEQDADHDTPDQQPA